ncbi:carbohydrate ABC transporter permease [Cellulomonas carbonis]|uniref:Sugar ABC transporter permease n=1 Tax=Cellulomonas carbonis T26 TaxID=947969 RepID=A0A0A0BS88_9CELL|nr:carbohydrate ABC transporter permease [Cellulomonas carbonis]KGM11298.1 sugar ABC transporter permease [Cellulomonas carbonis T26]GGC00941.1 sugar ABC transporter permease [Cellulomonas carbonis]
MTRTLLGTAKYVSLVVASVVTLLPLVVLVMASLKTREEFQTTGPFTLPTTFTLENYATAFTGGRMALGFVNTMLVLGVSVAGAVVVGAMTAYAIDRFEFRGRRLVLGLFLVAVLVPGVTTQVATFQIVNGLGVYNTLWAPILLFLGTDIVSIYIFLQFVRSVPKELDEAAMLEGANRLTVFWRIVFPLLKPAIATVVIIKGFAVYNDFYIPFLYMPSRDLPVLSTSLFRFTGPFGAQWEVIAAGVIIVILPTLVIFLALQRYIYNGFTSGATK